MTTNPLAEKQLETFEFEAASFFDPFASFYVKQIPLERPDWKGTAYWGVSRMDYSSLRINKHTYLHTTEEALFAKFHSETRREQFLRGRHAAKKALTKCLPSIQPTKIAINPGIFYQPLPSLSVANMMGVSIAHTEKRADSLWFPREHPMAIDVELLHQNNPRIIHSQLTDSERALQQTTSESDIVFFTRLWTIKEALSKVLMTGLTASLEIYQIQDLKEKGGLYQSSFTNFEQYQAISFTHDAYMCAIVLPKNTRCPSISLVVLDVDR